MRTNYINKLIPLMKENQLDAILVSPSEELLFFTGHTPVMCKRFQGLFIKSDGDYFYVCNLLYMGEVERNYPDIRAYGWFDGDEMAVSVSEALAKEGLHGKRIGVNWATPAFNILDIASATGITFVNAMPLMEEIRVIKTEDEIEKLRAVAAINDEVFSEVIQFIKPGLKEIEIKNFLFSEMGKRGGVQHWAIVARGPNSSYPHYGGSDGVVEEKDVILLDFGCTYNGLRSDMSRMVFVGGITEKQKEIYNICREATEVGQAACFEGAFIPDIDKAARDVIEAAGYGEYFRHRVGHGIGYMIHEEPYIKGSNKRKLEKGMCFSIEPGINLPGEFGMRIENILAITDKGVEVLNKSTHDIVIV